MTPSRGIRIQRIREEAHLPDLALRLNEVHSKYLEAQQQVVEQIMGRRLPCCGKCGRAMFPRRAWNRASRELRKRLRLFMMGAGVRGRCGTCSLYTGRAPLSVEDVEKLQRQVGLIK